jgi:hypothetical protein
MRGNRRKFAGTFRGENRPTVRPIARGPRAAEKERQPTAIRGRRNRRTDGRSLKDPTPVHGRPHSPAIRRHSRPVATLPGTSHINPERPVTHHTRTNTGSNRDAGSDSGSAHGSAAGSGTPIIEFEPREPVRGRADMTLAQRREVHVAEVRQDGEFAGSTPRCGPRLGRGRARKDDNQRQTVNGETAGQPPDWS